MKPLPQIPLAQTNPEHLDALLKLRENLTRNKQFGIGIVSGLELGLEANQGISIGKGYGFTSCGLPMAHEASAYTHFTPYSPPPHPSGLSDLSLFEGIDRGKPYLEKEVFKLLTEEEKHAIPLGKFENLAEYVVILFLEAEVIKGDKTEQEPVLEFKVIPLLANKEDPVFEDQLPGLYFLPQTLRFNPREGEITCGEDILDHFLELIDNSGLSLLQDSLSMVWEFYAPRLGIKENSPFTVLHLEGLLASYNSEKHLKVMGQYLLGFIQDLNQALKEFLEKTSYAISTHQFDPFPFPFHLALGVAKYGRDNENGKYRTNFQASPIFNSPLSTFN